MPQQGIVKQKSLNLLLCGTANLEGNAKISCNLLANLVLNNFEKKICFGRLLNEYANGGQK